MLRFKNEAAELQAAKQAVHQRAVERMKKLVEEEHQIKGLIDKYATPGISETDTSERIIPSIQSTTEVSDLTKHFTKDSELGKLFEHFSSLVRSIVHSTASIRQSFIPARRKNWKIPYVQVIDSQQDLQNFANETNKLLEYITKMSDTIDEIKKTNALYNKTVAKRLKQSLEILTKSYDTFKKDLLYENTNKYIINDAYLNKELPNVKPIYSSDKMAKIEKDALVAKDKVEQLKQLITRLTSDIANFFTDHKNINHEFNQLEQDHLNIYRNYIKLQNELAADPGNVVLENSLNAVEDDLREIEARLNFLEERKKELDEAKKNIIPNAKRDLKVATSQLKKDTKELRKAETALNNFQKKSQGKPLIQSNARPTKDEFLAELFPSFDTSTIHNVIRHIDARLKRIINAYIKLLSQLREITKLFTERFGYGKIGSGRVKEYVNWEQEDFPKRYR